MFSKILTTGIFGMETFMVTIESDVSRGLPRYEIVGLPDTAVNEAKERVRISLKNSGYAFPVSRVTINLAPADLKKEGTFYDLPMLVAILTSSEQLKFDSTDTAFFGELSLNGEVKRVNGALPMVIEAKDNGIKKIFIPEENAAEASFVKGIEVYPVKNVRQLIDHLCKRSQILPVKAEDYPDLVDSYSEVDFSEVMGQFETRRALEVAAAGGHNVIMIGSPGSGKSMLAKRLPTILPEMTEEESLETTKLYSIAGNMPPKTAMIRKRPFRSPHHTISKAGLSGGGTIPRPGEISLAHNGVLFLDELPEFPRSITESMRQPIEDGVISISRAKATVTYPCSVMLVCAMNPCPCGFFGHPTKECSCSKNAVMKYLSRVSGPLLDRVDIHIEVPPVNYEDISKKEKAEKSEDIRKRVNAARAIQNERFAGTDTKCNAKMTSAQTREFCTLTDESQKMIEMVFDSLSLSARAYDKILKVARTIADLDGEKDILPEHVAEAVQYRSLDRKYW